MPPEETPYQPSDVLHVGDEIEPDLAPQIAGKSIRITCAVKPESKNSIIVAQGGRVAGYSLYLIDGRPHFSVREARKIYTVAAGADPGPSYRLEARLQTDGPMTLSVNNRDLVTGKCAGLLAKQPEESMCVGFDSGAPVAKYKGNASDPFQGDLSELKVETGAADAGP